MSRNGDIATVFSEQEAVGVAVGLGTQKHRGYFMGHVHLRVGRQIVLYMKARVQITVNLRLEVIQYVKKCLISGEVGAVKICSFFQRSWAHMASDVP